MRLSLLVAMDENRGIGIENRLPWHISTDLKRFKKLTMGHNIILGRKTHQSIGKPLPGRRMIVLTRNPAYHADGCSIAHSLDEAITLARVSGESEVFVIGGSEIFSQAIDIADRVYLTLVHTRSDVDVYFPELDDTQWRQIESSFYPAGEKDQYPHTYCVLERKSKT
jgi:dihydrofolate reductase